MKQDKSKGATEYRFMKQDESNVPMKYKVHETR